MKTFDDIWERFIDKCSEEADRVANDKDGTSEVHDAIVEFEKAFINEQMAIGLQTFCSTYNCTIERATISNVRTVDFETYKPCVHYLALFVFIDNDTKRLVNWIQYDFVRKDNWVVTFGKLGVGILPRLAETISDNKVLEFDHTRYQYPYKFLFDVENINVALSTTRTQLLASQYDVIMDDIHWKTKHLDGIEANESLKCWIDWIQSGGDIFTEHLALAATFIETVNDDRIVDVISYIVEPNEFGMTFIWLRDEVMYMALTQINNEIMNIVKVPYMENTLQINGSISTTDVDMADPLKGIL